MRQGMQNLAIVLTALNAASLAAAGKEPVVWSLSEHASTSKAHKTHREEKSTSETETSTTETKTKTTSTTETATRTTTTTTTQTTSTSTLTTTTRTTTTTSTSTSTTGPHVFGGQITKDAFAGWLSIWRSKYEVGLWQAGIPDPWESLMPKDLKGVVTKVVLSSGGVAGGIVTEGMGYGIMIEGFLAERGDPVALNNSLGLIKSWLGMVNGPGDLAQPFAGGENKSESATKANTWPYGISSVEWSHSKLAPAGVPAWKFPINNSEILGYEGSAADGDQDAILGMVYTSQALGNPLDFVDTVVRSVISFASADLGFPDLYRTLPGGEKVFVPKLGSMWGGLTPAHGKYQTSQQAWCYSPGYFAPAHYRTFRDFIKRHWQKDFKDYLPPHLDGSKSTLEELLEAFDSAVVAGYNIMYYSSCSSGTVSNWVGVEAPCEHDSQLHCPGVPWKHTPYVGAEGGTCAQSGTRFGAFGADASRAAWRIAMDYILYREESHDVTIYDRDGHADAEAKFGAQRYLNRIVIQYWTSTACDGGEPGDCFKHTTSPYRLANAYDLKFNATNTTCDNVPNEPESWWAGFMAYPTFTAFVAPYDEIGAAQMTNWMDTFASICNFSEVNLYDFTKGEKPKGAICLTSYFEASQAVIATMVMADKLRSLPKSDKPMSEHVEKVTILKEEMVDLGSPTGTNIAGAIKVFGALAAVTAFISGMKRHRCQHAYRELTPVYEQGGMDGGEAPLVAGLSDQA